MERVAGFWLSHVLVPGDTLAAAGVAYHLADLLLPELGRVAGEGGAPDAATLARLLQPFAAALAATDNPALVYRLRCAPAAGGRPAPACRSLLAVRAAAPCTRADSTTLPPAPACCAPQAGPV